jgi:hypothetical protein
MTSPINAADFTIDPSRLDDEWVNHSSKVFEYAVRAADARREYEEAKRRDEVLRADKSLAIRKNPEEYGLSKVTEGTIDAAIISHGDVVDSAYELIRRKNELDVLMAAVTALDHKKKGLECLVSLHATAYYSNPSESRIERGDYNKPIIGIKPKLAQVESEVV